MLNQYVRLKNARSDVCMARSDVQYRSRPRSVEERPQRQCGSMLDEQEKMNYGDEEMQKPCEEDPAPCTVVTLTRDNPFETGHKLLPIRSGGVLVWLPWGLKLEEATMRLQAITPGSIAARSAHARACVGMHLTEVDCTKVHSPAEVATLTANHTTVRLHFAVFHVAKSDERQQQKCGSMFDEQWHGEAGHKEGTLLLPQMRMFWNSYPAGFQTLCIHSVMHVQKIK